MIFNKDTKEFQTRSNAPNENFANDDRFIVVDDESEIAPKIIKSYPFFDILLDENGNLVDIIDDTEARRKNEYEQIITKEIENLKQKLADTDYQAIKYAEGQISEEEYAPIKEQRQAWRNKINELEIELSKEGV